MAGFIIIGMGILKLGNLLKFIPYSLIVGFTSGIALIIFSSQINAFLGLEIQSLPADFIDKWKVYFHNLNQINWYALVIAFSTVLISLFFQTITNQNIETKIIILRMRYVPIVNATYCNGHTKGRFKSQATFRYIIIIFFLIFIIIFLMNICSLRK